MGSVSYYRLQTLLLNSICSHGSVITVFAVYSLVSVLFVYLFLSTMQLE